MSDPLQEESELLDQSGRPLGPRARDTRRRLLDATADLLAERGMADMRVIDIARRVGTSPATFYQYFRDVRDVVLCLARDASAQMPSLTELIARSWDGDEGREWSRRTVAAFIDYWDEHSAVLRVRNQAADEGDPDFIEVRNAAMTRLLTALADKVRAYQEAGAVPPDLSPPAAAAAMAAILERLAAYHRPLEGVGVTREDLVATSAHILRATLTGRL